MKEYSFCTALFFFSLILFAAQPLPAGPANEITVSAAISLKNAFEGMAMNFQRKHPHTKIRLNFGASGDLARQIVAGAPIDIFASAAPKDMDTIDERGLIAFGTRINFAENKIVLVQSAISRIQIESFQDLRKAEAKKIVIGNPKSVPAGRYAAEVLKYLHLWEAVKEKLIFAEHARQVLDYIARNEVDAAMVYSTDAMIKPREVRVVTKAPDQSHQPIVYPIAIVRGSKNEPLAREFIALVLSIDGRNLLSKYGFETVK